MPWRSTRPPSAAARAASKALDMREKQAASNRGGTAVGIARARQFKNRERMSIAVIKRILSFFARHEKSPGSAKNRRDPTSKAAQAWGFWGGNSGRAWARKQLESYEKYKRSRSKN